MLVEYFGRRFPELAAFAGGNYLVNAKTDKLVGATPQVTLMDKWISTNHLFITPSIGTPPGAGAFLLQLVVSMAYASQVPAFSGFEGSFSGQEITNFLAQMAKRNINNCNNGERR
jgi:hypothetical protein